MKWLLIIASVALLSGCQVIPKDVEFFQDKVERVPEYERDDNELLKQALSLSVDAYDRMLEANTEVLLTLRGIETRAGSIDKLSADIAVNAADPVISEKATTIQSDATTIKQDARKAATVTGTSTEHGKGAQAVTDAASRMVGSPKEEFDGPPQSLSDAIRQAEAGRDEAIDEYAEKIAENIGKKIEGSGAVQMGYFNYIMLLAFMGFVVIIVLKALAAGNPAIQVGGRIVKAGSKVVSTAATQMIHGVEDFKDRLRKAKLDPDTQEEIRELLRIAMHSKQDEKSKELVDKIRGKRQ
jgi:hypothetical protein